MRRKFWILAPLMALVMAIAAPASAATEGSAIQRTMEVTGRASMRLKYDMATISLGVSALEETALEAYESLSADLDAVVAALLEEGVLEEDLQTGSFSLGEEYEWLPDKGQQLKGYRATNMLYITTEELDQVAKLIQVAMDAGANRLNGVSFSVKDLETIQDELLDKAVDNAKTKADRVAKRLGTEVVGVIRVSFYGDNGGGYQYPSAPGEMTSGGKGDAGIPAPVYGGSFTYSVTINVTFELQ